ncbi:MAG: hypothetical protein AAGA85_19055 [Bacteroidota bacterium]
MIKTLHYCLLFALISWGCSEPPKNPSKAEQGPSIDFEQEKQAILATLNSETAAAFQRDYETWTTKWVHDADITKTYLDFSKNTFSQSLGWKEISEFVRVFIEENPEPEPVPQPLNQIDIRLYGNGAWVSYEQHDEIRGRKRETRLMEKVDGEWKIAGMQTTIYGFDFEDKTE